MSAEDRLQEILWLLESVQSRAQLAGVTMRKVVMDEELTRIWILANLKQTPLP
jgi:hypothetical protein